MLRHPSLIPLSHQHQHGLALCVKIERGLRDDRSPARTQDLARQVSDAYEIELRNHFDVEESILFPAIREHLGATPLVEALEGEHRKLEALIEAVRTADDAARPEALLAFSAALTAHIRSEERELFEDIQKRLSRETMSELGRAIDRDLVRVCLREPAAARPPAR
jgi:hemerythrin-like domain-containing protein